MYTVDKPPDLARSLWLAPKGPLSAQSVGERSAFILTTTSLGMARLLRERTAPNWYTSTAGLGLLPTRSADAGMHRKRAKNCALVGPAASSGRERACRTSAMVKSGSRQRCRDQRTKVSSCQGLCGSRKVRARKKSPQPRCKRRALVSNR